MTKTDTAIIIPVFNEQNVIENVLSEVLKEFKHVVCINDGSTDDTAEIIKKTSAFLVEHPLNLGQGAALQTGIDFALQFPEIQYFVTFDSDGQHRLSDVKKMLTYIKNNNVDIVLGSRFLGKVENITRLKKIILKLAVKFSNSTSGVKLTDTHNGLRVFNRKVASELKITMPDFSHASEIIERIAEKKFAYVELPVTITYTDYSRSKGQSVINAVNIGFDTILRKVIK
jgi:glycosyltransferase involved in cell wall biosynthesis